MKRTNQSHWLDVGSDVNWEDYGGKWARKGNDGAWWFLAFENKAEWGDGATGYWCGVRRVKVDEVPPDEIKSALSCCGFRIEIEGRTFSSAAIIDGCGCVLARVADDREQFWLVIACCLEQYGCYAPMYEEDGDSYPYRVRAAARRAADEMMQNDAARESALDRPCNALGATARDFGAGDPLAPLRRKADAIHKGDDVDLSTREKIILKMYAASGGRTLGGKVETDLALAGLAKS